MEDLQEIWKPVNGYEPYYMVSDMGNVKSLDRKFMARGGLRTRKGKVLTPQINRVNGYPQVMLIVDCKYKLHYVHRLVAEAFIPNPHNLRCVTHLDGNYQNNCADNLQWSNKKGKNRRYGSEEEWM